MRTQLNPTCVRKAIESWVKSHGSCKSGWDAGRSISIMSDDALSADIVMCSDSQTGSTSLMWCRAASWDSEILGIRVGRFSFISTSGCSEDKARTSCVSQFIASARSRFDLLIGRLDSRDVSDLGVLEEHGFRVMDSLITLTKTTAIGTFDSSVRLWSSSDMAVLEEIGRQSFRTDHYHADPRLSPTRCDDLYARWVRNACKGRAATVLVAEVDGQPSGFISCMLDPEYWPRPRNGSIDLIAIAPDKRGCGLGQKLVLSALAWFREQGIRNVDVGTQISNISAICLYERCGFQFFRSMYTVHGWSNLKTSPREGTSHA